MPLNRLAGELFKLLNAQLFLGFHPVTAKKRTLNKINRGILTLGDADPPIKLYEGPTARKKIKSPTATATGQGERRESLPPQSSIYSGEEDKSIGNVSRGEWI